MDKPEGEFLLKPIVKPEDTGEESIESDRINANESTPSTLEEEVKPKPPLAIPENYEDDLNKPEVTLDIYDNRAFLDREIHDDEDIVDIADRAGTFPYAPGFGPGLNGGSLTAGPESIPDVNLYQQKKTVAQGMMDLALFSANANQLRYVLDSRQHAFFYPGIILISFSLIFQVAVGVGLLWNTRYNVKDEKQICIANKVNNFTVVGIFLITVINVFISAFGTTTGGSATTT